MDASDTIAAISSAVGPAARMLLRLAGPGAHAIARRVILTDLPEPSSAARVVAALEGLTFPAWVYLFAHPRSYTGDDLVEFHIPGNPLLARLMLQRLIESGARQATPGEFTARAYLAGRIDLAQAEGVALTIAACNESELRAARQLLAGELSRRLRPVMEMLAETLALLEAGIDFSDEDISFIPPEQVTARLKQVDEHLAALVSSSARFERLSHEPHFVLAGRPNAGKSTLLNTLAAFERAIVSSGPGTTRDTLSAQVPLGRGIVRLTDVAGLAEGPGDEIARLMQSRAEHAIATADHILLLHDATDDRPRIDVPRDPDLILLTKADLAAARDVPPDGTLLISSRTGYNIEVLRGRLDDIAFGSRHASASSLALNSRHLQYIAEARTAVGRALQNPDAGPELVAMDMREALDALGSVVGQVTPDDLLGRIFSTFCIGK